jgi:3-oxoacyl-[acyl-carrier-protein] synthase II
VRADKRTRVVITGMGVKTPAGQDLDTFWQTLAAGQSTAGPIEGFDTSEHPVKFACEVRGFDPEPYLGTKEARRADRVSQLGVAAAADALADAGELETDPARCAVVAGTGVGGLQTLESQERTYLERGAERVSPFFVPMMMPNATGALVAMRGGFTGPNLTVTTACAAGAHAVGEGVRMVRDGSVDVAIAGGAEAAVTPVALAAFWRMGALSSRVDDPARAARPFDADRDGFVMAEGAAFVVLETLEHATARGARIWGEVLGYGRNCDAFHITAPSPSGAGAAACMLQALDDAGLSPSGVSHVNAHGTSTPLNDEAEAAAVTKVFGEQAVPVTGTKGVTGHLVGAAGAAEAVASVLALHHELAPPTANHENTDPAIAIDVVAGSPRPLNGGPALSNSFGFGGHNAALVLGSAPAG